MSVLQEKQQQQLRKDPVAPRKNSNNLRLHTVDLINATFQSQFPQKPQALPSQFGIVIDDDFNFMLSTWQLGHMNGQSFIKSLDGISMITTWYEQELSGVQLLQIKSIRIYFVFQGKHPSKWGRKAVALNESTGMFYLLQVTSAQDLEIEKIQHISSNRYRQHSPNQIAKLKQSQAEAAQMSDNSTERVSRQGKVTSSQFVPKIKIVDRFQLGFNYMLPVHSKYINHQAYNKYRSTEQVSDKEVNILKLLAAVFQEEVIGAHLVGVETYLRVILDRNQSVQVRDLRSGKEENGAKNGIFVGLRNIQTSKSGKQRRLGVILNPQTMQSRSVGFFDTSFNLSGLGLTQMKNQQSFIGIYRDNALVKQFDYDSKSKSKKSSSSSHVKELLSQQHMRGKNYVHYVIFEPQWLALRKFAARVNNYLSVFEREFEKRNYDSSSREDSKRDFGFKYWNSRNGIEQSSGVNSHWEGHWSDLSKSGRQTIKETPKNRAIEPLQLELIESKRPGFIFDRKKHRSPSRSPLKTKSPMRQRLIGSILKFNQDFVRSDTPIDQLMSNKFPE